MPNSSGRHSSNAAASASRSGDSIRRAPRYLAVVREALAAQAEPGVEAGAEVLERDPGGELDELRVTQVCPDPGGQIVGDLGRAARRRLGVLEDNPLALVEELARAPAA